ncbi:GEM-like protein 4 [Diospyros lotus]|uniref:GEM-like protein 4 n=1 Tax=Diospyros lotus TaxID=55363 RepID=UPI00224CCE1D|nr:GEM-like protein 4 [Diospyros lotus]
MKNQQLLAHVLGLPLRSVVAHPSASERTPKMLLQDSAGYYHIPSSSSKGSIISKQNRIKKLGGKADNLANGIREHVRLGPKITETVKGKLSLGAKILRAGGVGKIFKRNFSVREGEKLLKASQCYLSTTAGPIAGLLFISTDKVAFCSERSIELRSPTGELIRMCYKVLIPLEKILRANESQNMKRPSKKYIEIVTVDNFDFWFMGFLNYGKTIKSLQQAISQAQ